MEEKKDFWLEVACDAAAFIVDIVLWEACLSCEQYREF